MKHLFLQIFPKRLGLNESGELQTLPKSNQDPRRTIFRNEHIDSVTQADLQAHHIYIGVHFC